MKKQSKPSLEEIQKIYKRSQESGLSRAEFARREKIPYWTLNHYRRRLIAANKLPSSKKNLSIPKKYPPAFSNFVQVFPSNEKSNSNSNFLLKCSLFELEIPPNFDSQSLTQLLEILKKDA